ncbi:ferredoxin [Photobacterium lipolyticum]|uniref:Ferredoxin n=1 Tax=Photobacterium lipolyticum TaxID=266810 RepID=A0A2T3N4X4_9GAMM|nr:ferredoxin [Photobacterium lipolyticum]PSW07519.1 hypothetical protein C9I89_02055 [Photobacterium lipolyticum]
MNLVTASLPRATAVPSINLVAFYQLGDCTGLPVERNCFQLLRPALFANYHDLSRLRYDFPLILVHDNQGQEWVRSLADTIDGSLQKVAPRGIKGEERRRQVLNQEQEIRNLVSQGLNGSLSSLWEGARLKLQLEVSETMRSTLGENLAKAHAELDFDGEIIDCDAEFPKRVFTHGWEQSQRVKSMQLCSRIDYLMQKLSDILRIDYLRSSEARDAGHLERSVGTGDKVEFDFQAMARILKSAPVGEPLPKKRSLRIREAMAVFKSQRFVTNSGGKNSFSFAFESCELALEAFRTRLPEMAMLVKAISIAELEIENRYDESQHDSFYRRFDQNQLGPEELAQFPSYLVVLGDKIDAADQHAVLDILRSGLPFKIIAQTENIIGELSTAPGQLTFGTQGQQLARMALGLNTVFVLQSAASSLYPLREHVMKGLASDLPALFSVYSPGKAKQPCYLTAAAATESRAFPCFVFDPACGEDMASRFHLVGNPRAEQDWPRHQLKFEDSELNGYREETAFTLLDFIACDSRFAEHFACIEPAYWSSNMLPVDAFLDLDSNSRKGKVPYVLLIDEDDVIHRAVCDIKLIDAAKRCRDLWRNLQELGGINNSHALKALALATTTTTSDETVNTGSQQAPAAIEATAQIAPDQDPAISSDAPWIETIRCTSCNECTELNDRMFAYDENKRAYIANPEAGSYRELVEAAENCQVSIIHPGKPINLDEPGLEKLIARAEPFST